MAVNEQKLEQFVNKVVTDLSASYAGVMISTGRKLGLYDALASIGPATSGEVAIKAGCSPRYVQEWLNSQVAGGYLEYHPVSQCYELSAEQHAVLADSSSSTYFAPAWDVPGSMWADQDQTIEAFKSGSGVSWGSHDARLYEGVATFYRSAYKGALIEKWIPALEGVSGKLGSGAKVADVGCGYGHSTVIMADSFTSSSFYGFDTHRESLDEARGIAAENCVEDRVSFEQFSADRIPDEQFDLVCFFDCLHDMGEPEQALRRVRDVLAPGGSIMVVEPSASDSVEGNIGPVGQLYYAASATLCVAHSISENGEGIGAQAGYQRLRNLFLDTGFSEVKNVYQDAFNMVIQARV